MRTKFQIINGLCIFRGNFIDKCETYLINLYLKAVFHCQSIDWSINKTHCCILCIWNKSMPKLSYHSCRISVWVYVLEYALISWKQESYKQLRTTLAESNMENYISISINTIKSLPTTLNGYGFIWLCAMHMLKCLRLKMRISITFTISFTNEVFLFHSQQKLVCEAAMLMKCSGIVP